jgi:hypothetical protein
MAWTRIQAVEGYTSFTTTNSVTIAASASGSVLVVVTGTKSQSAAALAIATVTDNMSNTYTLLVAATDAFASDGPNDAEIWYCLNPIAGVTTISLTAAPTPARFFAVAAEYTPPSAVTIEASTNTGTSTTASLACGPITTTGSSDLLIAGGRMSATSVAAPFALTINEATHQFGFADSLSQAAASYTATFTLTANIATAAIGAFKAGGGAVLVNFLEMLGCGS